MPKICTTPKYCAISKAAAKTKILSGNFDGVTLKITLAKAESKITAKTSARVVTHEAALYANCDVNFSCQDRASHNLKR
jgi:hypothetical protein